MASLEGASEESDDEDEDVEDKRRLREGPRRLLVSFPRFVVPLPSCRSSSLSLSLSEDDAVPSVDDEEEEE